MSMLSDVLDKCGEVSHDEADEIAGRYIDAAFRNPGERPRHSIPARPERDDDLRLHAYIAQQRAAEASTQALREAAERLCVAAEERLTGSFSLVRVEVDALRSALAGSPAQEKP